jgi:glycosyltransferase involved in cell wall biosynthesis
MSNRGNIVGGGEISLVNLIMHLDGNRISPIVAVPAYGDLVERLEDLNIPFIIIDLPTIRTLRPDLVILSIFRLLNIFRQNKIDLVHANGSRSMLFGGLASLISGVPCIWHLRIVDKTERIYDQFLFGLAKKVIAISSAVTRRLSWAKRKEKISLIPNGVNTDVFHPANKRSRNDICRDLGLDPGHPIICSICQITPFKGIDVFIRAAARIIQEIPTAQFIVCGREVPESLGYRRKLEEIAEDVGVRDKINFIEFRSDTEKILGATDVFVLSSVGEAFGRVVIEAMASEVPVVGTNDGGIPDIIEHGKTGYMFEAGDHRSLARYIIGLVEDEETANEMSRNARDRVTKLFSIKAHAEAIQSLYEEVLT